MVLVVFIQRERKKRKSGECKKIKKKKVLDRSLFSIYLSFRFLKLVSLVRVCLLLRWFLMMNRLSFSFHFSFLFIYPSVYDCVHINIYIYMYIRLFAMVNECKIYHCNLTSYIYIWWWGPLFLFVFLVLLWIIITNDDILVWFSFIFQQINNRFAIYILLWVPFKINTHTPSCIYTKICSPITKMK